MEFRAVDLSGLRAALGDQCSPDPGRSGYVIGPDINGRLCHVASCRSVADAIERARSMNGKRCEPCRQTGAIHCADPANCGGPWSDAGHPDNVIL